MGSRSALRFNPVASMWLLLLIVSAVAAQNHCPSTCSCKGDVSISCDSLSASDIMQFVEALSSPWWTNLRTLAVQRTPALRLGMLPRLKKLEVLDLSRNQMEFDWDSSQSQFRSVVKLNVEHNNLTAISRRFLLSFPSIEELHIGNNRLTEIGFDSLRMPKMRMIRLNDNRITSIGMHILRFMPFLSDVDFSGNLLSKFVTSDFSLVGGLRYLNLSRNRIETLECDTAQAMPSLETLDLSENLLTSMPSLELKDMTGLRTLNLSGNPITTIGNHHISLDHLKVLDLSSTTLHNVESGAFSSMHQLHSLHLNDNRQLVFLSPNALENRTLFSLDLSNTGLKTISLSVLQNVAQVRISGVPLDCGCTLEQLSGVEATTIRDWETSTCKLRSGHMMKLSELAHHHLDPEDYCKADIIVPFGTEVVATLGERYSMYCSGSDENDVVTWKNPHNTINTGEKPTKSSGLNRLDYFTSTLFEPEIKPVARNRTLATSEYYRIDVVLQSDEGVYECSVRRGKNTVTRRITLKVVSPSIELQVTDVGITTLHLTWSKNLQVPAADRVSMQIVSRNEENGYSRAVQLSLQSVYCSYNMINLNPNQNYTVCLRWLLTDNNSVIFSTCSSATTKKTRSILDDISPEFVFIFTCSFILISVLFCISRLWQRLHVYNTAKQQSKLIQSVSGQSMLTQSISSDTTMYENPQLELTTRLQPNDQAGPLLLHVM